MSKAFTKEDSPAEDATDALPQRPAEPLPITPHGYARLSAELSATPKDSRRARVLAQILDTVRITDPVRIGGGAGFGCLVTVEYEDGDEATYQIVGPDEVTSEGQVSVQAPLARALLGKEADDEVTIRLPRGPRTATILKVICPST